MSQISLTHNGKRLHRLDNIAHLSLSGRGVGSRTSAKPFGHISARTKTVEAVELSANTAIIPVGSLRHFGWSTCGRVAVVETLR